MLHIRRWSLRVRLAGAAAITAGIGLILSATPVQAATANFFSFPAGACSGQFLNDVATGANGAVWVISSSSTCQVAGPSSGHGLFEIGGKRLAVAPNGLPWIVTFSGQIIRMNADGSTTTMPGAANDIGIGPAGGVWIIGTNSVGGGFAVWEWTGSSWITPPGGGSGEEIDVASDNQPIVDNSGGHIFVRSSNGAWGEYSGLANDIGVGANGSSSGFPGEPGGSPLWVIGTNTFNNGDAVWNFFNGTWQQSQFGASQIAVDSGGTPWVTAGGNLFEG
jgi:hypothetical protein